MTADKYQPYWIDRRITGIESDVSEVKRIVAGMYEKVDELAETADSIHDIVRDAGEPKYNHAADWDLPEDE